MENVDFASMDFSNLLLWMLAKEQELHMSTVFTHPSPQKTTYMDKLTFGDFEPWHILSNEEVYYQQPKLQLDSISVSHYGLWQHTKEKVSNLMNSPICLLKLIKSLLWHIYTWLCIYHFPPQ